MLIKGNEGQNIKLKIDNYEFPEIPHAEDGNWLQIYLKVKSKLGEWETKSSCLMTWDVTEIIRWFRNLANKIDQKNKEPYFLEPNIAFCLLNDFDDDVKKLEIRLDLEQFDKKFRPLPVNEYNEYLMIFNADKSELIRLADELQEELNKYPER